MSVFEKNRDDIIKTFKKEYQNKVGFFSKDFLHNNSKELLEIIKKFEIINNNSDYKVLEVGAGGCRNLTYINNEFPNIQLFANDLHKEESLKNTHPSIKNKINFYGEPTQTFITQFNENNFDLIIDSDHLVHINYTDTKSIINHINNIIKPTYFLIRSITIDNPHRSIPYHKHNFNDILSNYEEIYHTLSKNDSKWYIKLFKLKN